MLQLEEREQLFQLLESSTPLIQIARRLGRSIGTVHKYKCLYERRDIFPSAIINIPPKIVPFADAIRLHLKHGERNATKIFHTLQGNGYKGSYPLLNSYIRGIVDSVDQKGYKRSVRVETEPGEQAQVDWGSFGRVVVNGRKEKLYAFVYILSYSRAIYVEFVVRQSQQVLQNCHIHAFERLGMPKAIRYDNMKTVVLGRKTLPNGEKMIHWNPSFQDFTAFYGFQPELCPPYWPRAKGKVEAAVKYLRNSFAEKNLFKKNFSSLEQLNAEVTSWLDDLANQRLHGTTKQQPKRLWQKEKQFLTFPIGQAYNPTPLLHRRSTKDGLIQYKSTFYSVPMAYAQKKLFMRESINRGLPVLEIYDQHECIARHQVSTKRGEWVVDDTHASPQGVVKGKSSKHQPDKFSSLTVMSRELTYYNNI